MAIIRATLSLFLAACCGLMPAAATAETLTPGESTELRESDVVELAKYSNLLDSDRFSQRRLASQELAAAGARALPLLEQAALGTSREATARAMAIIQQQFVNGDATTRREAESHLQRIAASSNEFAARRAHEVLHPESSIPQQFQPIFGNVMPANRAQIQAAQLQAARIQMQAMANQAQVRRINFRHVNGEKTITVTENNRTVTIREKKDTLEVEVTEKKEGQETTQKYSAKDADELKKKHPEAYEHYKKHNNGGGVIQIGNPAIQGRIQIRAAP